VTAIMVFRLDFRRSTGPPSSGLDGPLRTPHGEDNEIPRTRPGRPRRWGHGEL